MEYVKEKVRIDNRDIILNFDLNNKRDKDYYEEFLKKKKAQKLFDFLGSIYYIISFFIGIIFIYFMANGKTLYKIIFSILIVILIVLFFLIRYLSEKKDREFFKFSLMLENTLIHLTAGNSYEKNDD